MQPAIAHAERNSATITDSLAAARDAWQRGEFDACLAILDQTPMPKAGTLRIEYALLQGRAFLRADRPAEAIPVLESIADRLGDPDAACSAKMLLGSAVARSGDVPKGMALLEEAAAFAALGAHRTIVAEIDCYLALTHRLRGNLREAEQLARRAEQANADIISVRAIQLRAFLLLDQQRYAEAHALFHRARKAYDACREMDAGLAYNIDLGIAVLEADLRSAQSPGDHQARYQAFLADDTPSTIAPIPRLQRLVVDAWAFALDGDATRAAECAWAMERFAHTDAWKVYALATRAAIHRAIGEPLAARQFADQAADLGKDLDWGATRHEERYGLLTLADEMVRHDVERGIRIYGRYRAITEPIDALLIAKADPRFIAREEYVAGIIARAQGRYGEAMDYLTRSVRRSRDIGRHWGVALAYVEIYNTPAPGAEGRRQNALEAAAMIVEQHFPNGFLARMVGPMLDPTYRTLTDHKRQILHFVLEAMTNEEIAERMDGPKARTIDKHRTDLLHAFGVTSTAKLISVCRERGIT